MELSSAADAHLVGHYAGLGDLKADFRNYNLFALVASIVRGNSAVDLGCGTGSLLGMLRAHGMQVLGIEPSRDMRALCAQLNPGMPVIEGHAEDVDALVAEPVDTVLMIDVLEHVEGDEGQVRKVRGVLKDGGEFVFVVPAYHALYGERDRLMGHYRRYSKKVLRELLEANGFELVRLRYWNALGVLPYLVSEKILRRPLSAPLRGHTKKGSLSSLVQKMLSWWFSRVENNVDFGFGLSIIGTAVKRS